MEFLVLISLNKVEFETFKEMVTVPELDRFPIDLRNLIKEAISEAESNPISGAVRKARF